jgi:anti-sigma regulatory factor (Ser/Thr protein kinase)
MNATFQKSLRQDVADVMALGPEVNAFLERHGASKEAVFKVRLALEEMLLNLIDHATGSVTQCIAVQVDIEADRIVIVIEDDSDPFDIRSAPAFDKSRPLEERRPRGMGIQLVRSLMDEISYERLPSRNRLRLVVAATGRAR